MLKLVGALMVIFAGFLAGYTESHKLVARVEKLETFLCFLSSARAEIRYSSMPVDSILAAHGEGIEFFSCLPNRGQASSWTEAWNEAVERRALTEGFGKKDIELLKSFGAGFGSSDTEGQLAHFCLYENLVSSALREAKEERDRKSKLFQMLGIFGGAAAAILLC